MNVFLAFISLVWLMCLCPSTSQDTGNYVQDACSVTQYRDICIRSLAPFSNKAKNNPTEWARAGVSVTIGETKKVARYLAKLMRRSNKRNSSVSGKNSIMLSDCVESIGETLGNLHRALGVLRQLNGQEFSSQMEDVITWMSTGLTYEDTCLDGFDGKKGKQVKLLRNRITNLSYLTSNALALVNKLATTGPGGLVP